MTIAAVHKQLPRLFTAPCILQSPLYDDRAAHDGPGEGGSPIVLDRGLQEAIAFQNGLKASDFHVLNCRI